MAGSRSRSCRLPTVRGEHKDDKEGAASQSKEDDGEGGGGGARFNEEDQDWGDHMDSGSDGAGAGRPAVTEGGPDHKGGSRGLTVHTAISAAGYDGHHPQRGRRRPRGSNQGGQAMTTEGSLSEIYAGPRQALQEPHAGHPQRRQGRAPPGGQRGQPAAVERSGNGQEECGGEQQEGQRAEREARRCAARPVVEGVAAWLMEVAMPQAVRPEHLAKLMPL